MTARLEHAQFEGFAAYALENDALRVVVLPELGGKIISLRSLRTGREWLWRNPHLPLWRPPADVDNFGPYDSGGWDEIFPTVNPCVVPNSPWGDRKLTDHGELWHQPWHVEFADTLDDGAALLTLTFADDNPPFQFTRSLLLPAMEPKLELNYELVNHGEQPLPTIWAAHPLFAVNPGDQLHLPTDTPMIATASVNLDVDVQHLKFAWPMLPTRDGRSLDLARIPAPAANFAIKLFTESLQEGAVQLVDAATLERVSLRWNNSAIPHLGLWLNYGAWSGATVPHYFNLGVEPTTYPHDDLATAAKHPECPMIVGSKAWSLSISVES
jgi:galactose mutarotase-like enzyme